MGEILLVRHGQANAQAKDEEGYDRLSELGRQQGALLGEWLRGHEAGFDRVLTGTLRRHRATARAMGVEDAAAADPRLNEMDYFNLGMAHAKASGIPFPQPDEFAAHIPIVMEAWSRAEIQGNESFADFEARVGSILTEAAAPGVRVLCVTSGGVIGMMLRHLLLLDPRRMALVLLPIWNSSVSRIHVTPHGAILAGFNAIPHLDAPDRASLRTHY